MKYKLIAMPAREVLATGSVERIGEAISFARQVSLRGEIAGETRATDHPEALRVILSHLTDPGKGAVSDLSAIDGFGHRVVHGAEKYSDSVLIDGEVLAGIRECSALAPLHNPPNLVGIEAAMEVAPGRPQVACFDTAFHQTLPPYAYRYALPEKLYREERIRRYGFHGTSHRYVSRRACEITGKDPQASQWISCHLGNGCSIAAIDRGHCVDTSMGLTPLEGLVMGTRSGDVDPAVLLHLSRSGWSMEAIDRMLNRESGLLGLSGFSNDMREVCRKREEGDAAAGLAVDVFAYRLKKYIGSYLAALNGCDGILFTGGIGEYGVEVRQIALSGLDQLGIALDAGRNESTRGVEGRISSDGSRTDVLVIPTDEEGEIARDTYRLIAETELQ